MASPVSFGDAYTMAKLAFRLGQAFTKGRRSARAEFHEVENQLYALSTALEAVKQAVDRGGIRLGHRTALQKDDPVLAMLTSCNETLAHLDKIVKDYGNLSDSGDKTTTDPIFKRVGKTIKANWKTIHWTTEGGDIATLRSQLTLHTNSLGLILGVANNSRTADIDAQVSQSSEMLQEIYQWFIANLRNSKVGIIATDVEESTRLRRVFFELRTEDFVCRRAAFATTYDAMKKSAESPDQQADLFRCHCSYGKSEEIQVHVDQVSALTLSPLSFPIRLSENPRTWLFYKIRNKDTHQLQSIRIRCISLKCQAQFEEQFADRLAIWKARDMLQQGKSTIMAHLSPDGENVRMLNILGDTSLTQSIDSVTFASPARSFTRQAIDSVKLLHYKSLPVAAVAELAPKSACPELYDSYAELIIFYKVEGQDHRDISRTILYLELGTAVKTPVTEGSRSSLTFGPVKCTSFRSDDEQESSIDGVQVVLSFSQLEAATKLYMRLIEMRLELVVISRQYPRHDESVSLHLLADEVLCDNHHIENAVIDIVVSRINGGHRLIIRSQNGCTVLSQDLPRNLMSSLVPGTRPDFSARTYGIQMQERDGAVYRQLQTLEGLPNLRVLLTTTQNNRLLDLGFAAIAGIQEKAQCKMLHIVEESIRG